MAQKIRTASLALTVVVAILLATTTPAGAATDYTVKPGDTLSVIARDHGVATAELAAANGITNRHLIRIGQTLTVPTPEPTYHTVSAGESLSGIAATYGISTAELAARNGITNPNRIRIGQKLELPPEAGGGATTSPEALAARYPSLPSRVVANPDRLALVPSFERWAAHYGVPVDLVMAVAYQESGWQAAVISNKGAIGVGQLLPGTATWIANDLIGVADLDPYNPDDNIRMSARFLLWLIGYLGGESEALAGYYQGPTSVSIRGLYDQTQTYVANVQAARPRFQQG